MNELIAGTIAAPKDLPADAVGSVGTPNTLPADSAGIVGTPNTVPSDSAGIIAAPTSLPSQGAAALPRSLTPMVDFDFAAKRYVQDGVAVAFEDIFTYTRASSATFTNRRLKKNGGYEYFLDTDYVGSVENLLTYSEDLTDADWIKSSASTLGNQTENPIDGFKNADKIVENTETATHKIQQDHTFLASTTYTLSFYAKKAERDIVRINIFNGAVSSPTHFDLNSGTITLSDTATAAIVDAGNGWYRCSLTAIMASAGSPNLSIVIIKQDGNVTYTGDGVSGIYVWGVQLTESAKPLPYVKTLDVAVTKIFAETLRTEYDAATGKNLGALIEGGSTNLALHSEEFSKVAWNKTETSVLSNTAIAPDGTFSADTLIPNTSGNSTTVGRAITDNRMFQQTTSVTVSTNVANSIYVKSVSGSSSLLSIYVQVGDGIKAINTVTVTSDWQRIDVSADVSTGLLRFTICTEESVYIWGAQSEHLPFATSYIRTEGAAVSRSADGLSLPSAGNISGGDTSVYAKISVSDLPSGGSGTARYFFQGQGLSGFNIINIENNGPLRAHNGSVPLTIKASGAFATSSEVSYTFNASQNIISGYYNGELASSADAGLPFIPDFSGVVAIGSTTNFSHHIFGHISKFSTYAQALTAQEITLL